MERRGRSARSSSRGRDATPAPVKASSLRKSNSGASDVSKASGKRSKSNSKARAVSEGRGVTRASKFSMRRRSSITMSQGQHALASGCTDRPFCDNPSPSEKRKSHTTSQHKKKRSRTTPVGEDSLDGLGHGLYRASISPSGQDTASPNTRKRRHSSKSDTATPGKTKGHKDFAARRKNEEKGQGAWLGTEHDNES